MSQAWETRHRLLVLGIGNLSAKPSELIRLTDQFRDLRVWTSFIGSCWIQHHHGTRLGDTAPIKAWEPEHRIWRSGIANAMGLVTSELRR